MVSVRRHRWWLVGAVAVLALAVQAAAAVMVWQHTRPRLPGLAAAVPTLDHVIAAVITAAGDKAAVALSDLVPSTACQNTPLAKGSRYTRTADLYTSPGNEDALIGRIAAALPASDHPQRPSHTGGGAAPLNADPGTGIHLQVIQIDQGWVAATAKTDCRASEHPQPSASPPPADSTTALTHLLAKLDTTPDGWHSETITCPTGRIITVDALSQTTTTGNLPTRLAASVPAGARTFTSVSNRLAWREGPTSVIVAASDDGTRITAQRTTTTC